ncbi:MAG: HAD-IA family hydrolase [Candidatus Eremiobacteraeota bacterium]|nr:HAD-IA family hydrolase [Candidatus Eremiobacteraeota bacterium]
MARIMLESNLPGSNPTPTSHRYDAVLFDLYGTLIDDTATAVAGAIERLEECRGASWAIVTSTDARLASRLIAHAGLPAPPLLVTADDVARNKPAPDGYLYAATRLGVAPARAIVLEDTAGGIAAARSAGMDVVAVLRGRSQEFARGATFVVKDLTKLRLRSSEGAVYLAL